MNLIDHISSVPRNDGWSFGRRLGSSKGFEGGKGRFGVAYDPAFCFYYRDNLEVLKACGGEVIRFFPMRDFTLPNVDLV